MPSSSTRQPAYRTTSFRSTTERPSTPLDPAYQISSSSSSRASTFRPPNQRHGSSSHASSLRPPNQRHGSSHASSSSRDRRSERAEDDASAMDYAAELPMQVTENVVADIIRLDGRMRELEEMLDLFESFKQACPNEDVHKELCFYFVEEVFHSYRSVRHAWAEVDDLRACRYGTEEVLTIEDEAGAMVRLVEEWMLERKKQRRAVEANKEKDMIDAEEADTEKLQEMIDFTKYAKRGMQGWRRDGRREDIRGLRKKLLEDIMTMPGEQR